MKVLFGAAEERTCEDAASLFAMAEMKRRLKQVIAEELEAVLSEKKKKKKKKNWMQDLDPEHKGYCTPMTKKTCTPKRKALAKRFKKAARKKKKEGGTGWQGKV